MPAKLRKENDKLTLEFGRLDNADFKDSLMRVRSIAGRRFNGETKRWEFPADFSTAQKIVHIIQPEMDAEVEVWFRNSQAEAAAQVTTELPTDVEADDLDLTYAEKLYPYQRAAILFMRDQKKLILGDDMGLGKTVQAISTVILSTLKDKPVLIVCPNSVKGVWAREIREWAGEDDITIIDAKKPGARLAQLKRAVEKNHWIIVNWEKLRLMPELAKVEWNAVIADEAHRAKNRKAKQTKALWKLRAPVQLALTGTPIQNSPDELWSLLKWLHPKEYRSYWAFYNQYVEHYEGYWGKVITGVRNPDALRFELADKLIRRTKDEVLDLPEKVISTIPVEMGAYQRKLYSEAERAFWLQIKKDAQDGDESAQRLLDDPGSIFLIENGAARCVRLRQIASSPALLDGDDKSAKLDACIEIIKDAPEDKQFVIFTQFKRTVELIEERLEKAGISSVSVTGLVPVEERTPRVKSFQDSEVRVFVATQAAGGVGLTLTAADTAIFIERDWVPANNEQAEDRLHRIGQKNNVSILILEATDTIDDGKVATANRQKENIVATVIEKDERKTA